VMHEPEKSDAVVVAVKPANKAEQSAAEPVEPRTETEGNAGQQSTHRAQDRASVSQALERVRQVARQRKKERFTSLLHHVDPAMLRTAFYAMKREAAPGVDGMTWETYEEHLDRRIEDLHARVKRGAYRALPIWSARLGARAFRCRIPTRRAFAWALGRSDPTAARRGSACLR
jgi:RNA-directed DNA polymerase